MKTCPTSPSIVVAVLAVSLGLSGAAFAQESRVSSARAAVQAAPRDADAAIALGRALRVAGETNEALTVLRRAASLGTKETQLVAHREIARTLIARRDFDATMGECKSIANLPAQGAKDASHVCAAEAHLLWRRANEALVETAAVLGHDPRNYDAKVAEGLSYALQLKDDAAHASYRDAIALDDNRPEAHIALGRLFARAHLTDDAITELRRAASIDHENPDAAYELAIALPHGAEQTALLQHAVEARPTFGAALRSLADAELAADHLDAAKHAAADALRVDPREASSHVTVGRVLLAQNDADGAIASARDALKIMANLAPAHLLIADAYASKGEIDLAVESYQTAYGLDHEDPTPLVHATNACIYAGRVTSAKAFGAKATSEFAWYGPAWIALGDAYATDKDIAAAKHAYESAKKARGVEASAIDKKLDALR